jgi:small nuclear ribonucleoprotein (snRNP)-like protein
MVRSSSSSFRNTKGKLETLGDSLNVLLDECKETRTDTRVSPALCRNCNCG